VAASFGLFEDLESVTAYLHGSALAVPLKLRQVEKGRQNIHGRRGYFIQSGVPYSGSWGKEIETPLEIRYV